MDRVIARNVLQSSLDLPRERATWVAEALTAEEVATLSHPKDAPAEPTVREIAGAALGRIRAEYLPPAA
jgi:hypothetical protein